MPVNGRWDLTQRLKGKHSQSTTHIALSHPLPICSRYSVTNPWI